jgi:DNA-directed RNA polymerase subunit RPC12/RpoP
MEEKQCPSCGSAEIYSCDGGLAAVAFGRVNGLKLCPDPMTFPTPEQYSQPVTAYVCTKCGRLDLFSADREFLARIKSDPTWTKV